MKKTVAILLALLFALQIAFVPAAAEGEGGADVPEFATADDVAAFIREEMVDRKTEIRFKADDSAAAGATLSNICAHTENGAEGDYLRLALNYVLPQPEQGADGVYTLRPVYFTTAEQEAAVDAYVETVVAGCTAQDATEIAQYLYDYLCEHVTFDLENLYNDADLLKYTAYGAAVNGRAVCQGFASLYYKLALAAGLDCRIVTGKRGADAHAWNIIQIDDLWYHVDASSGAQLLDNSAYFMKRLFDGYTISYGEKTAAEIQGYSFVLGNEDDEIITGTFNENISFTLNNLGLLRILVKKISINNDICFVIFFIVLQPRVARFRYNTHRIFIVYKFIIFIKMHIMCVEMWHSINFMYITKNRAIRERRKCILHRFFRDITTIQIFTNMATL